MTDITDMILVTVAPGECLTISPHPSGIPDLGPLYLGAGDTHRVTPAEAERLYQAGKIVSPVTGQAKRRKADRAAVPTVTYGSSYAIPISDHGALVAAAERATRQGLEEADRQHEERRRAGLRRNGMEPRNMVSSRHPTGSIDPLGPICALTPEEGGWA